MILMAMKHLFVFICVEEGSVCVLIKGAMIHPSIHKKASGNFKTSMHIHTLIHINIHTYNHRNCTNTMHSLRWGGGWGWPSGCGEKTVEVSFLKTWRAGLDGSAAILLGTVWLWRHTERSQTLVPIL